MNCELNVVGLFQEEKKKKKSGKMSIRTKNEAVSFSIAMHCI